jgi:GNAT superfamily N-acetyltransferase
MGACTITHENKQYRLVPVGGGPTEMQFFGHNAHYQYELFMQLMDMLKATAPARSFWHNRSILLRFAQNMSILITPDTKEIVAFCVVTLEGVIDFFQVFVEGKGIGRALVEHLKTVYHDALCVTDTLPESVLFWQRVGVRIASGGKY